MSTQRRTIGYWLVLVCSATIGCSPRADTAPPATLADGAPNLSVQQINQLRLPYDAGEPQASASRRPALSVVLPRFNALSVSQEWGLQETAADALARIGVPAVPTLLSALENKDPRVRARAAQALARIGPEASAAVSPLTKALSDADPDVRRYAARALGQIGLAAVPAIPELAVVLAEPEETEKFDVPKVEVPVPAKTVPGPSPSDQR